MIPLIGIMIGAYIITRMLQLIFKKEKDTHVVVGIFAILTIILTLIVIVSLMTGGLALPGISY